MKEVLIVDDSTQLRQRLIAMLSEDDRIRVVGQAGDARNALNELRHLKPDAVVLDIQLPGRSGIDLLKEIKARYPDIMVVMFTNHDYPRYRQQCKRLGADHFLNKTLEFEQIAAIIIGDAQG